MQLKTTPENPNVQKRHKRKGKSTYITTNLGLKLHYLIQSGVKASPACNLTAVRWTCWQLEHVAKGSNLTKAVRPIVTADTDVVFVSVSYLQASRLAKTYLFNN